MILRFLAVDGENSFSPPHVRIGRVTPIGKTRNESGAWVADTEPASITLGGPEEASDLTFLRKEVNGGRIKAADDATAKALGLKFDGVEAFSVPPPFAQHETLPAPHSDTTPPPAFEAEMFSALTKRKEK